mmetsp:Transcript_11813/g.35470  ORF Transcript_11813/g.35470 Transcript_11813/m.35470 type:complete len:168 (+) Transcript_11813:839-1342(+)
MHGTGADALLKRPSYAIIRLRRNKERREGGGTPTGSFFRAREKTATLLRKDGKDGAGRSSSFAQQQRRRETRHKDDEESGREFFFYCCWGCGGEVENKPARKAPTPSFGCSCSGGLSGAGTSTGGGGFSVEPKGCQHENGSTQNWSGTSGSPGSSKSSTTRITLSPT